MDASVGGREEGGEGGREGGTLLTAPWMPGFFS
jgi:hypothetical protein